MSATRRHKGIALLYNVQSVAVLPVQFWRLTTDVYVFQQLDETELKTLAQRCMVPEAELRAALPREFFKYRHIKRGRGFVEERLWVPGN